MDSQRIGQVNGDQVVGVYDKGNLKIYVDGEKLSENTVQDSIASSSRPVGIGYDAEKGRKVDGEISIARIYNKALSAEEINGQRKSSSRYRNG